MTETAGLLGSGADYPSQDGVDRRDHFAFIVHLRGRIDDPNAQEDMREGMSQF